MKEISEYELRKHAVIKQGIAARKFNEKQVYSFLKNPYHNMKEEYEWWNEGYYKGFDK